MNGDHDDPVSNGANNLSASLSPVKVETTNGACIPPAIPPHNTATKVTFRITMNEMNTYSISKCLGLNFIFLTLELLLLQDN